jgi:hypothetical protein
MQELESVLTSVLLMLNALMLVNLTANLTVVVVLNVLMMLTALMFLPLLKLITLKVMMMDEVLPGETTRLLTPNVIKRFTCVNLKFSVLLMMNVGMPLLLALLHTPVLNVLLIATVVLQGRLPVLKSIVLLVL